MIQEADIADLRTIEPNEDDVGEIFYTSGTTANPKGVMLTHRNLYLHALSCIISFETKTTDVHLHTIPLFHVNGWGAPQGLTCQGATHVMLKGFDPATIFELVERERVTTMSLVPTMANALLNHPDLKNHDYSSLCWIGIGGAAPTRQMVGNVEEAFGCRCYTGYGLTETAPVLAFATIKGNLGGIADEERLRRQAMTGWAQIGVELRVVDDNDRDVKCDGRDVGEVITRGDCVMKGYWRQPEDTARALRNGWFRTGDLATIDEEGYLLIVDRKKDIIISGGENIASIEIEECLASHPDVLECAVIAVPDAKWGEVPKGIVVFREGVKTSSEEILDHCKQTLAGFKCPKSIDIVDSLPKGGTGKIQKRLLRAKYWPD
jgi:fatty-acyl-CoA synthase